ncbi:MAG TPA: homoserine dehydrogenase, partial [Rhizomicrobium sp.]|nr:homoserine dehydrogenase [Rhizomicrobium sp.]
MKPLKLAIAGLGTVGAGVVLALADRRAEIAERAGCTFQIVAVAARDKNKKRGCALEDIPWTDDVVSLANTDADVIVELIGGEDGPAYALAKAALGAKKHLVTANKALLAYHGAELAALAEENGVTLRFEAAAAGGIPIVKALRESFIGYGVHTVRGILNGTCNYILTQMEASGLDFAEVLAEAQRLGFAEADPELDVGGGDTAHKLALLSSLAFGVKPDLAHMRVTGIRHISFEDIQFAREFGYRIKLLGIARKTPLGLSQLVQPAMVKRGTPLAEV